VYPRGQSYVRPRSARLGQAWLLSRAAREIGPLFETFRPHVSETDRTRNKK
jgi:hypothetical protein